MAAPHVAPHDPVKQDFRSVRKPPSATYRLGTDEVGRDVLSRLVWGARASLLAGVIPVTIALVASIPLGLLSGCTGGWLDGFIMRITDAMLAIPFLIVASIRLADPTHHVQCPVARALIIRIGPGFH